VSTFTASVVHLDPPLSTFIDSVLYLLKSTTTLIKGRREYFVLTEVCPMESWYNSRDEKDVGFTSRVFKSCSLSSFNLLSSHTKLTVVSSSLWMI
jgi:hypothetical protein